MPKTRSTALPRFRILNGNLRRASVQQDGANCEINKLEPFTLHRRRLLGAAAVLIAATALAERGSSDGNRNIRPNTVIGSTAMEAEGLVRVRSGFAVRETMDRAAALLKAQGITVFARIDHAEAAAEAGLPLRSTELLIFGSAKSGTPLMQENQTIGIDLPLKALVFADADGNTWFAYNDPRWVAQRHGIFGSEMSAIDAMTSLLETIAAKATK
jgi:uncharacterized protein (DUF302 family)